MREFCRSGLPAVALAGIVCATVSAQTIAVDALAHNDVSDDTHHLLALEPGLLKAKGGGGNVRNLRTNALHDTIAEAVNFASAGDTLQVIAATMTEGKVDIDKNITLEGQTGNEVVLADNVVGTTWFETANFVEITVRDLTFDGSNDGLTIGFAIGGDSSFERVHFRSIRQPGLSLGSPISTGGARVDVSHSIFEDFGRSAIRFFGPGFTGVTMDNAVFCRTDGTSNYGYEVDRGAIIAVERTSFMDCGGDSQFVSAGMILLDQFSLGTTADVISSTFQNNTVGVSLFPTASVNGQLNRFSGNLSAVSNQAGTTPFLENNWWGCNAGPNNPGCDTTPIQSDFDPWLILTARVESDSAGAIVVADLTETSDSSDTPGNARVQNITPVSFASSTGTFCQSATTLAGGIARSRYIPGAGKGNHSASVTVDNETVNVVIDSSLVGSGNVDCESIFGNGYEGSAP